MRGFSRLKIFFSASLVFSNLLIPIILLLVYCQSFVLISLLFLLKGVNYGFTFRMSRYLLVFSVLVFFLVLFLRATRKEGGSEIRTHDDKVSLSHLPLLALPLTPVVQYLINNQEILSLADILVIVIFFTLFFAVYVFLIPALLRKICSTHILVALGLAFAFSVVNMPALSLNFNWFENGNFKIQLIYFGFVFLLTWGMLKLNYRGFLSVILVAYLVFNSAIQLISYNRNSEKITSPAQKNELQLIAEGRTSDNTPNIYLLVYDVYVSNETMLGYGIDNSTQEKYLKELSFIIYPSVYSIDAPSINSMSRVLNASIEYGGNPRKAVSGDGNVQNALKRLGYKTYGLFPNDYLLRGIGSSYDYTTLASSITPAKLIISAVLIGEFRGDIGFNSLSRSEFLDLKQEIFINRKEEPIFIYSHSDEPSHSQISGECLPNETDLYKDRLLEANHEMRQDIDTITRHDPEAIVIVAGDHGPYLTKNCFFDVGTSKKYNISEITRLDIQDRFGTFLAIRWPTEEYDRFDDITVLQDLFPAIFAYLYQDTGFLELKVNPEIISTPVISGASVRNGIIIGGINDGEPLFFSGK